MARPAPSEELIAFVDVAELEGLDFFTMTAHRGPLLDGGPERGIVGPGSQDLDESTTEIEHDLAITSHPDEPRFLVRFKTTIDSPEGSVEVGVQAEFTHEGYADPSEELRLEYANKVAISIIAPHIRYAVADLTSRVLGAQLLLPVLRAGQLTFGDDPPDGDVAQQ